MLKGLTGVENSRDPLGNGPKILMWATRISTVIVKNYTYWLPKYKMWATKPKF